MFVHLKEKPFCKILLKQHQWTVMWETQVIVPEQLFIESCWNCAGQGCCCWESCFPAQHTDLHFLTSPPALLCRSSICSFSINVLLLERIKIRTCQIMLKASTMKTKQTQDVLFVTHRWGRSSLFNPKILREAPC